MFFTFNMYEKGENMKWEIETYAVLVAFLCNFFAIFLSNGIIVGVPSIASEFGMSNFIQNWIPTILFLVMLFLQFQQANYLGNLVLRNLFLLGL